MRKWILPALIFSRAFASDCTWCGDPVDCAFSYPKELNLKCPRNFYFHLDGLAWQAKQGGMEYAIRDSTGVPPLTGGQVLGFSQNNKDWKFQPGLRLGIGYFFEHDQWSLNFDWTWLNITDYKRPTAPQGSILIPLWLTGESSGAGLDSTSMAAKWKAEYNVLDIAFSKPFLISMLFNIAPHIGIRTAWIDQNFSVRYNGTFENISPLIHHGENNFWGIGARIGAQSELLVGKNGIFFFGNAACSIVYGKFTIVQDLPFTGALDGFDITDTSYQNIPNFELALGVGWETFLVRNRYHLSFRMGYEFQEWFDQLRLRRFYSGAGGAHGNGNYPNSEVSRNNLTLNGFSLRFQFDL